MHDVITHPNYAIPFMQPGRLVKVKHLDHDFGWGAVVNFSKRQPGKGQTAKDIPPQKSFIIDVLLSIASDSSSHYQKEQDLPYGVRPPAPGETGKMEVVPVVLSCIEAIGHVRLFLPKDLKPSDQKNSVRKMLEEVKKRFPDGIAVLDPIENMGITDDSFKKLLRVGPHLHASASLLTRCQKIEVLESRLLSNPLHHSPRLPELYDQYAGKVELGKKIREVKKKISDALSVMQLDELKCRKRVLRRLGFINEAEVVQLKARVACEISTGDELLLSELLFNRFFNELTPEQCAACLSCFIFEEKSNETPALKEELAKPFREIQAQARIVAKVSMESKLPVNEEEYLQNFKYQLMEVVYAWSQGASFAQIWYGVFRSYPNLDPKLIRSTSKMTDVYEGSLIRLFRRLEELLRQIAQAAKVMGSEDLEQKFEVALKKVRRDIVAAQSLYL